MEPAIFGAIDTVLAPIAEYVVLVLVLVNMTTRLLGHRSHVRQAKDGEEDIDRYRVHDVSNVLLLLATFYLLTIDHHPGFILGTLVIGTVVSDVFEFESRLVEARQGWDLEAPKAAILGSVLVLLYAAYVSFLPAGPIGQFL